MAEEKIENQSDKILPVLEKIEVNTRPRSYREDVSPGPVQPDIAAILERIEANTRTRAYRRRMSTQAGGETASPIAARANSISTLAKRENLAKAEEKAHKANQKSVQITFAKEKKVAATEGKTHSKAVEAQQARRESKDRKSLFQALAQGIGKASSFLPSVKAGGDATDAAGTAAGGVYYTAFKEVADSISDFKDHEGGIIAEFKKAKNGRNEKGQYIAGSAKSQTEQQQEGIQSKQQETLERIADAVVAGNKQDKVLSRRAFGASDSGGIGDLVGGWAGSKIAGAFAKTRLGKWIGKSKLGTKLLGVADDVTVGATKGGKGILGKIASSAGKLLSPVGSVLKTGGGKIASSKLFTGAAEALSPVVEGAGKILSPVGGMLKGGGKLLGKTFGPLAAIALGLPELVGAAETGDAKQIGGATGSIAGGFGGAAAGTAAGAALGSIVPGLGTALGGIVGGILGAMGGDWLGEKTGEYLGESIEKLIQAIKGNTKELGDGGDVATGVNWGSDSQGASTSSIERAQEMAETGARKIKRKFTGETVAPIQAEGGLGSLSSQYESGSKGSAAVGWDSTGGTSYGKYQIASKTGTMNSFMKYLEKNNPEAYQRLSAAGPADAGKEGRFAQEWKALAAEGKLGTSEHDFIKASHFDPAYENIDSKDLRDRISKSKAMQDVLWSTSVQHGAAGASKIFNKVYKDGMSDDELVKAVYDERGTKFGSSSAQVQASVQNRFKSEQQQALGMLAAEKQNSLQVARSQSSPSQVAQSQTEAPVATATAKKPIPAEPVSLAKKGGFQAAQPSTDMSGMEKKMDELIALQKENADKQNGAKDGQTDVNNTPQIPMEYDDETLMLMAYDRV